MAILIAALIGILLSAIPAYILMILLGVLSHLTGWGCNFSFLACYVILAIISLFVPKGSRDS